MRSIISEEKNIDVKLSKIRLELLFIIKETGPEPLLVFLKSPFRPKNFIK